MDLGMAALGTKMYPGQPAPGTRGHAENNLLSFILALSLELSLRNYLRAPVGG